jgi:dipeptidyl aminopeptidase/acylaminoacyl peptidase
MSMSPRIALIALLMLPVPLLAQPVSYADLARHVQYRSVKISPDGEYFAATAVVKNQTVLALIRRVDMKVKIIRPRETDDVVNFWWGSDKRVVYTLGVHQGGYAPPLPGGELFGVNADGSYPDFYYGQRKGSIAAAEFIAPIDNDPDYVLVALSDWTAAGAEGGFDKVYRMNLRSGQMAKSVATSPARQMSFVADHSGHVRFAFGEDIDGNAKVYLRSGDAGGWKELMQAEAARCYPVSFDKDDQLAYFDCSGAHGGPQLRSWNPATDAWNVLWSNPKIDMDGLVFGPARDDVIGVGFTDGRPGVALFDDARSGTKALVMLMQQFPGEHVSFVSGTRDGQLSVVLVEADADPGTFYLYDSKDHRLTLLFKRASWIDPLVMARKQPYEFTARDGMTLQGYLSLPPGLVNAKHLPMVIFVHGGPYGINDDWDYDPYVQLLATRGYAVLQVNFRGSGGRGYDFMRAGWGEWGGKMQDDVTDATRWAIAQGIADPRRLCIFGASYGGYAALEGVAKEPDLYRCAIGYVGVYDLNMMVGQEGIYGKRFFERVLGKDRQVWDQRSPLNQLDSLKANVMLIVGGKDETVAESQGLQMKDAFIRHHKPLVWLLQPDEMHGFYDEVHLVDLYGRLIQFLSANIGPGTGTAATVTAH